MGSSRNLIPQTVRKLGSLTVPLLKVQILFLNFLTGSLKTLTLPASFQIIFFPDFVLLMKICTMPCQNE